jgi:hypothetical protein
MMTRSDWKAEADSASSGSAAEAEYAAPENAVMVAMNAKVAARHLSILVLLKRRAVSSLAIFGYRRVFG